MGSYLDSLRFRKEVAKDISVRRQKVYCFMVGEHGFNIVPLWSNVHVYGVKEDDLTNTLKKIRRGYLTVNFSRDIAQAMSEINKLITESKIREAYEFADQYPPDLRVVLKSNITHYSKLQNGDRHRQCYSGVTQDYYLETRCVHFRPDQTGR